MTPDDREAAAFSRAIELARTGHYSGWRAVDTALRQFRPEIAMALAGTEARTRIDILCRKHWNTGRKAG